MNNAANQKYHLKWIDGLKAFAILGILLNHFVEAYGGGPWFSNPSANWPDFGTRLGQILPEGDNILFILIKFLGWLGDMGPGVFILISGFTLTLSQSKKRYGLGTFYMKRLLRIYPLYITVHILIVFFLLASQQAEHYNKTRLFMSLLGLRWNEALFFYINPSWWFIWIILQLYLFFPLLFRFLNHNKRMFLIITLAITLLSRLAGILDFTYSNSMYRWMTGLFFGTRLFEFTLGMYLGYLYFQKNKNLLNLLNERKKVLMYSILIYLGGFGLSLTYAGSLFSNILISIGLSGIFLGIYEAIKAGYVQRLIGTMGVLAFPVFLIHQPVIEFISGHFPFNTSVGLNIVFMGLCFPLGYLINKGVDQGMAFLRKNRDVVVRYGNMHLIRYTIFLLVIGILIFNLIYPFIGFDESMDKYMLASSVILLGVQYLIDTQLLSRVRITFTLLVAGMIIFFLFGMHHQWFPILSLMAIPGILITLAFPTLAVNNRFNSGYIFLMILLVVIAESYLRDQKPVEIGRWGEYPALQKDDQTVYSLIPNKTTHLRYNNYDYTLHTNSMGFNSPEIDLSLKKDTGLFRIFITGDAFTMPEGVEYQRIYPRLLEENLEKHYPDKTIQVINGGVTGYGPNEMWLQLKTYIDTLQPDLVINQLFINEFNEINITLEKRRKSIGFEAPPSKLKIFWYSQLSIRIKQKIRDWINKPDHSRKYSKSLGYLYRKIPGSRFYADTTLQKMDRYLEKINKLTRKHGSDLLVMYVPGQIEVSKPKHIDYYPHHLNIRDTSAFDLRRPNKIMHLLCHKHNIRFFDTEKVLANHPQQPVYYPRSWHWNREGHQVIANQLSEIIKPY